MSDVPNFTIPEFGLYGRQETAKLWEELLPSPTRTNVSVDGMSLLQLPPNIQHDIVDQGAWPIDGRVPTSGFTGNLESISHERRKTHDYYNVKQLLEGHYAEFLQVSTSSSSSTPVHSSPAPVSQQSPDRATPVDTVLGVGEDSTVVLSKQGESG